MTGWIDAKKRWPKKAGRYLVWLKNGRPYVKYFENGQFYRKATEYDLVYKGDFIKYWQPIEKPDGERVEK